MREDNVVSIRRLHPLAQEDTVDRRVALDRVISCLEYLSGRASAMGAMETANLIDVSILAAKQDRDR
jgi:hypothetical protein